VFAWAFLRLLSGLLVTLCGVLACEADALLPLIGRFKSLPLVASITWLSYVLPFVEMTEVGVLRSDLFVMKDELG